MAPIAWMTGTAVGSWLVVRLATDARVDPEVLLGMAGPLVSAGLTWVAVVRTHTRAPERLTSVMTIGFAVKMLAFGLYVVAMVRPVGLRPLPFVVSFASYFIGLHVMEALFLKRLLTSTPG